MGGTRFSSGAGKTRSQKHTRKAAPYPQVRFVGLLLGQEGVRHPWATRCLSLRVTKHTPPLSKRKRRTILSPKPYRVTGLTRRLRPLRGFRHRAGSSKRTEPLARFGSRDLAPADPREPPGPSSPEGVTDRRVRRIALACQADLHGGFEDRHLEGLTLRNGDTGRVWDAIRATIEYTMVGADGTLTLEVQPEGLLGAQTAIAHSGCRGDGSLIV